MADLFWTTKLPTEDGWYWHRQSIAMQASIILVIDRKVFHANAAGLPPVEWLGGEWYGPLEEPGGDAIENCPDAPRLPGGGAGG